MRRANANMFLPHTSYVSKGIFETREEAKAQPSLIGEAIQITLALLQILGYLPISHLRGVKACSVVSLRRTGAYEVQLHGKHRRTHDCTKSFGVKPHKAMN